MPQARHDTSPAAYPTRVSGGDPAPDLHDEHGGGLQPAAAQGDEDERSVAERRGSAQAVVPGQSGSHAEVDAAGLQLGEDSQPAGDSV